MYISEIFSVKKAIFLYFSSRKIFLRKNFTYKLVYKFNVTRWTSMCYGKEASQYHETKVVTPLLKQNNKVAQILDYYYVHCFCAKWGFPPKERHPLSVRIFSTSNHNTKIKRENRTCLQMAVFRAWYQPAAILDELEEDMSGVTKSGGW